MELPPPSPASSPHCRHLALSSLGAQRPPRGPREAVLVPWGLEVGAGAWRGRGSVCWANPLQPFVPSRSRPGAAGLPGTEGRLFGARGGEEELGLHDKQHIWLLLPRDGQPALGAGL